MARVGDQAVELELELRWTRAGCTRLFALELRLYGKAAPRSERPLLGSFEHTLVPLDRWALEPLVRLARQPWWWLVLRGPSSVATTKELRNTLDLGGLLREKLPVRGEWPARQGAT